MKAAQRLREWANGALSDTQPAASHPSECSCFPCELRRGAKMVNAAWRCAPEDVLDEMAAHLPEVKP